MLKHATPEKYELFCAALADSCNVGKAAAAADVDRRTVYRWRETDPVFASAWDEAKRIGVTALEDEAHRRAFDGIDKPITHLGKITDMVKEYSDTLAIFLLKAHDPEKYRERSDVNLKGHLTTSEMTEDEIRDELAALVAQGFAPPALLEPDDDGNDLV